MLVLSLITFNTVQNQRWWSAMNHPLPASILAHRIKQRARATMVEIIRRDPSHSLWWKHTHGKKRQILFFFF